MPYLKFSILIMMSLANAFEQNDCLNSEYTTEIKHKASPFGLADNILTITKKACLINIQHQKLKFINKVWKVDVCRGPVHIKQGTGAVEVLKRQNGCLGDNKKSDYCSSLLSLKQILEDDGLIFATGEKEKLATDHGRVYCSYFLLMEHLEKGTIFSRYPEAMMIQHPSRTASSTSTGSF